MKREQLKKIIKEEVRSMLKEGQNLPVTQADLDALDLKPLESKLKSLTGVAITLDVKEPIQGKYFNIASSKNLVKNAGIFKAGLKEVKIETFNSARTTEYWWMTINISYKIKSGGSNGIGILTAWYYPAKKNWAFRED